ncbi:MAG: hypothetical protein U0326_11730 [Polyangiales bacterium]
MSTTICGRKVSTVPAPPRRPSTTKEWSIPVPRRGPTIPAMACMSPSTAALAGSATRNTALKSPDISATKSSGPR